MSDETTGIPPGPGNPCGCEQDGRPLTVAAGEHFWCTCGRTSFPPHCDGSHKGTGKRPLRDVCPDAVRVRWCGLHGFLRRETAGDDPPASRDD